MSENNNLQGIILILISVATSVFGTLYLKELLEILPTLHVNFFSKLTALVILLVIILIKRNFSEFKIPSLSVQLLRTFLSISNNIIFFFALDNMDMSDVVAISYFDKVLWVIIGAVYFKEKLTKSRVIATITCTLGMMTIYLGEFNLKVNYYCLLILLGSVLYAINAAITKHLSSRISTKNQMLCDLLFTLIAMFPFTFFKWQFFSESDSITLNISNQQSIILMDLNLKVLYLFILSGGLYYISLFTHTKSLKKAEISVLAPFTYSKIVFAFILDYIVFSELPDSKITYIGYAMIIIAGVMLGRSEAKQKAST